MFDQLLCSRAQEAFEFFEGGGASSNLLVCLLEDLSLAGVELPCHASDQIVPLPPEHDPFEGADFEVLLEPFCSDDDGLLLICAPEPFPDLAPQCRLYLDGFFVDLLCRATALLGLAL